MFTYFSVQIIDAGISPNVNNGNYTVVVYAGVEVDEILTNNELCRSIGAKMICCGLKGVCGYIFNDALENFTVLDTDGEIETEVRENITHQIIFVL